MPTWLKVVLGLFAAGMLTLGVIVAGVYWWVTNNKDRVVAETREARTEGMAHGAGKAKTVCVDEAIKRVSGCGVAGFVCEVKNKVFLTACLGASNPDPSFCNDVPSTSSILAHTTWSLRECMRHGRTNDQPCTRLMQGVSEHCHPRARQ